MMLIGLVCIYSSTDRDHVQAMVEKMRHVGIVCALVPSDRLIGTWDIEVSPDDGSAARLILDEVGAF